MSIYTFPSLRLGLVSLYDMLPLTTTPPTFHLPNNTACGSILLFVMLVLTTAFRKPMIHELTMFFYFCLYCQFWQQDSANLSWADNVHLLPFVLKVLTAGLRKLSTLIIIPIIAQAIPHEGHKLLLKLSCFLVQYMQNHLLAWIHQFYIVFSLIRGVFFHLFESLDQIATLDRPFWIIALTKKIRSVFEYREPFLIKTAQGARFSLAEVLSVQNWYLAEGLAKLRQNQWLHGASITMVLSVLWKCVIDCECHASFVNTWTAEVHNAVQR